MKKIGNYTVHDVIGQGGMGKIYKAYDPKTKETVIIKQLMIKERSVVEKRFQREAELMSLFNHQNIVKVYNQFTIGKSWYITMEFVDGLSLDDLIKKNKRISSKAALLILLEICEGLKYAHDNNVVHRDIKPDNVLLSRAGDVKLCDFGIATARPGNDEGLTNTGVIMGTPAYMSPEQLLSSKHVDKRSDIYSTGVMLYQMVTGEQPFPGSFTADSISKIRKGKYIRPQKLNPGIPRYMRKVIKKMMHCKKNKRYDDLKKLIHKLRNHAGSFRYKNLRRKAIRDYLSGKPITKPTKKSAKAARPKGKKDKQVKKNNKVLKKLEQRRKKMAKLKVVKIHHAPKKKKTPAKKQARKSPAKSKKKPAAGKSPAPRKASGRKKASPRKKASSPKKSAPRKKPAAKFQARETFKQPIRIMAASNIVSPGSGGDPVRLVCRGRNIELKRSFQIGRDKVNKIVLANDNAVSRKHAKIIRKGKACYLVDTSSNGTLLNGRRVQKNKRVRIHAGDTIRIGKTTMILK